MGKHGLSQEERLLASIEIDEDGCWICKCKNNTGNGYTRVDGILAHRLAYTLWVGPIPGTSRRVLVLHKCDKRRCVKPPCLYLGSHHRNNLDAVDRRRWQYGDKNWTRRCNDLVLKGEKQPNAKLTNLQASEIRELYKTGLYSQRKLEKIFGISHNQIGMIVRNKAYKEVTV